MLDKAVADDEEVYCKDMELKVTRGLEIELGPGTDEEGAAAVEAPEM